MVTQTVRQSITLDELCSLAHGQFGDFLKAVVDIRLEIMPIEGELYADEEGLLMEEGSRQADLYSGSGSLSHFEH